MTKMTRMVNDRVGDMLTRIRNASSVKKKKVIIPCANISGKIAKILFAEGFIGEGCPCDIRYFFKMALNYKVTPADVYRENNHKPYLTRLKRISTPGLRVYVKKNEIPKVLGGVGIAILSTSEGLMTDRQARARNIGGEILCYIW